MKIIEIAAWKNKIKKKKQSRLSHISLVLKRKFSTERFYLKIRLLNINFYYINLCGVCGEQTWQQSCAIQIMSEFR
jgi:hypothetical protein